jgi:hypothetical protein
MGTRRLNLDARTPEDSTWNSDGDQTVDLNWRRQTGGSWIVNLIFICTPSCNAWPITSYNSTWAQQQTASIHGFCISCNYLTPNADVKPSNSPTLTIQSPHSSCLPLVPFRMSQTRVAWRTLRSQKEARKWTRQHKWRVSFLESSNAALSTVFIYQKSENYYGLLFGKKPEVTTR